MVNNINPMPEIEGFLRKLRLLGALENLSQRTREATANKLTYPEFLALLLQDEVLRRENRRFDRRMSVAGFKSSKTISSFDFSYNPNINRGIINEVATCQFIKEKVCVLIVGPCGTGKSHLAQAIGYSAVQQSIDVMFVTQTKLLRELHTAKGVGNYEKKLKAYIKVPLLIIDDFGLKPITQPHDEDLHELIAERYENASTIITSNLDVSEWLGAFPNNLLGSATIDRLRHNAYSIVLDGKSYRQSRELLVGSAGQQEAVEAEAGKE